jgi:hypothetical protein
LSCVSQVLGVEATDRHAEAVSEKGHATRGAHDSIAANLHSLTRFSRLVRLTFLGIIATRLGFKCLLVWSRH